MIVLGNVFVVELILGELCGQVVVYTASSTFGCGFDLTQALFAINIAYPNSYK